MPARGDQRFNVWRRSTPKEGASYTVVAKDLSDREETAAPRDDEFGLALPEGLALALPLSIALWAVMA